MICQFKIYILYCKKKIIKLRKNSSFNWFTPFHVLIRPEVIWKKISRPLYHVHFTGIHTNSRHKCMYMCIYMYICLYLYAYVYVCICLRMHVTMYTWLYVCLLCVLILCMLILWCFFTYGCLVRDDLIKKFKQNMIMLSVQQLHK